MDFAVRRPIQIILRVILLILVALILATSFKVLFRSTRAAAANAYSYPNFCLGGWERPQLASGAPASDIDAPIDSFTEVNSAFLESSVAAQIFCGYFSVEERERLPSSVSVQFNWRMKFAKDQEPPPPKELEPKDIKETKPTETTEQEIKEQTVEQSETEAANVVESAESNSSEESAEEEATEQPAESSEPPLENEPTPESSEPEIIQGFRDFFITKAFAQESSQGGSAFLEVSYSLDGVRWVSIGKVTASNWRDFKVQLPINSWDDLKRVQMMVNTIPTVDAKPDIYLENIALTIGYDRTLVEATKDSLASAGELADSLASLIGEGIAGVAAVFTEEPEEVLQPEQIYASETPKPAAPPPPVKERQLTFVVGDGPIDAERVLPWHDAAFKKELTDENVTPRAVDLKLSTNNKSLTISGSCSRDYFVVLLFRKKDDYLNRPGLFAANIAEPCKNGSYKYNLRDLPTDTAAGDYYLLVAEQSEQSAWAPISDLVPVTIDTVLSSVKDNQAEE
jgi:hypothetical protein